MGRRFIPALVLGAAAAAAALAPRPADAALNIYFDADFGTNSLSTSPYSAAKAQQFDNTIGATNTDTIEFENSELPSGYNVGDPSSGFTFNDINGVNVSITGQNTYPVTSDRNRLQIVNNTTEGGPADPIVGFNTTVNGQNWLKVQPTEASGREVKLKFAFTPGVKAFGGYFSGLFSSIGNVQFRALDGSVITESVNFNDLFAAAATAQGYTFVPPSNNPPPVSGAAPQGGLAFFGFTSELEILNIEFFQSSQGIGEVYGVDGIRVANVIPEPAFYQMGALIGLGLLGMVAARRRKPTGDSPLAA
jgi:hypothetical protein